MVDLDNYIVYGRSTCPYCTDAVNLLESKQLSYDFFDHEQDREFLEQAKRFYNRSTVPIVLKIDSDTGIVKMIGGCDDLKGYLND